MKILLVGDDFWVNILVLGGITFIFIVSKIELDDGVIGVMDVTIEYDFVRGEG